MLEDGFPKFISWIELQTLQLSTNSWTAEVLKTLQCGKDAHQWWKLHKHYIAKWCLVLLAAVSRAERQRLLHVVIVGGGPTGVEFAGELSNFIRSVSPLALATL